MCNDEKLFAVRRGRIGKVFNCQGILVLMSIDFAKLEPPYLVDLICTCGEECLKCMFCLVCMLITKVIICSVHTKTSLYFTYTVNPIYYLSYPFI